MNQSHSQGQSQTQSPLTSAHIAQTMTLLYMTSAELLQTIDVELSKNPALEAIPRTALPDVRPKITCHRTLPCLQSAQNDGPR